MLTASPYLYKYYLNKEIAFNSPNALHTILNAILTKKNQINLWILI